MLRIESGQGRIRAAITLPGSKSISNRLLILREVLGADTEIQNISNSSDTVLLVKALEMIRTSDTVALDIAQAGTDMRFLTAFLACKPGTWTITGSERMKERPLGELIVALRSLGANITCLEQEGFPPLCIEGRELSGSEVSIGANVSSQFISALLLISPLLKEGLVINLLGNVVSRPYIKMTLGLLKKFGFRSLEEEQRIQVFPRLRKRAVREYFVESDWSAASYYYSVCALAPDCSIELKHLHRNSLQADAATAGIFSRFGVSTMYREGSVLLTKKGQVASRFDFDFTECPDIAQTVAVTCAGLGVGCHLTGLQTLRLKETDRIHALKQELLKIGVTCKTGEAELSVEVAEVAGELEPVIETYDDHRMAMSFAPLANKCKRVFIKEQNVVNKSYPAFWEDFASLGFNLNLLP